METNRHRLVSQILAAQVAPPLVMTNLYEVGADGTPRILPSVGGITLSVRVGDSCFGHEGDHVEPAVSARHSDDKLNAALNVFACIGNVATVTSGEAKGARGTVTGKHGGVEHVIVDFAADTMAQMQIGDTLSIRAVGVGLAIVDAGDVRVFNCDPDLLERIGIERDGARFRVPVARIVPARVMGSGLGRSTVVRGDYDIQCFDEPTVREFGLDRLRLGDLVAIVDADNTFGRIYRGGAVTIAGVSHGRSFLAGHGPGVTTLLTSASGAIEPVVDERANLATLLDLR
ncbi:MAG TPA: DUF4438 domain-containing protein [Candidatus Baltobacteraceae bacterium]|nr:DUF4438 domain-containing protein [Candidatus Baltobacteraceae bacterium]